MLQNRKWALFLATAGLCLYTYPGLVRAGDFHVDVVVIASWDRNPVATNTNTHAIVEARPTDPTISAELPDADKGLSSCNWSDTLKKNGVANSNGTVSFTSDPNNDGTWWQAKVTASFSQTGSWDVYVSVAMSLWPSGSDHYLYGSGGPTDMPVTVSAGPAKVEQTSVASNQIQTHYVEEDDNMQVQDSAGNPYTTLDSVNEAWPTAHWWEAEGYGPVDASTWSQGSGLNGANFVDHQWTRVSTFNYVAGEKLRDSYQVWSGYKNPTTYTLNTQETVLKYLAANAVSRTDVP